MFVKLTVISTYKRSNNLNKFITENFLTSLTLRQVIIGSYETFSTSR